MLYDAIMIHFKVLSQNFLGGSDNIQEQSLLGWKSSGPGTFGVWRMSIN